MTQHLHLPVNIRSAAMWSIFSRSHSFTHANIVDIGCGYGDLMRNAIMSGGASFAIGVDRDKHSLSITARKLSDVPQSSWKLVEADVDNVGTITEVVSGFGFEVVDAVFCTSVLPYLRNWRKVIEEIKSITRAAFFEVQYSGDGPGFDFLKGDDEMLELLEIQSGWGRAERIGQTYTGRTPHPHRTLWMATP